MKYPKRLIEVDLPIKAISAHARREKSIRHGHISTLHIWWARRPLAACRAVICAALWPDPADDLCPQSFRDAVVTILMEFAGKVRESSRLGDLSTVGWPHWNRLSPGAWHADNPASWPDMRYALLDFIADFANWDASTVREFLETARALTQAAHESLGGEPGTRPLVVDPFAGGGSIPLEALRVGADAFASDLNPVAVLLNKVVLEYIPKYGKQLADEVRKWGKWIKEEAEKELAEFYPKDPDGATPIAYLWARTITCEGPGCGAEVPLMKSLWLAKKPKRSVALQMISNPEKKRVDFRIIIKDKDCWIDQEDQQVQIKNPKFDSTVKRGSATCPCCGFTTPVESVRRQLKSRKGGAADARLLCIVSTRSNVQGRFYRLPNDSDLPVLNRANTELDKRIDINMRNLSLTPTEPTPLGGGSGAGRAFNQRSYGMDTFADLFTKRQLLSLTTFVKLVCEMRDSIKNHKSDYRDALLSLIALLPGKLADLANSLCRWEPVAQCPRQLFGRQAISIVWDFAEGIPIGESSGSWEVVVQNSAHTIESNGQDWNVGIAQQADAKNNLLLNGMANVLFTDPPYYDAVPYSDLSDFFYVWLKRLLPYFGDGGLLTPKDDECIVDEIKKKDAAYFMSSMEYALMESKRVVALNGIGIVIFAHKSTSGWESQLEAMLSAGWIVTASWPIDTECGSRLRARDSAALASSVHLVCRPREKTDDDSGDWRDILAELPKRIHSWMPRLAREGVVGADAIFACLGPALEIFSRYSHVEKPNGDQVTLKEYLEHVWAAVAREALNMIFDGADATGYEEDARITAMWLWTLFADKSNGAPNKTEPEDTDQSDESDEHSAKPKSKGGYCLEYDAARKIAQGLGVHLEKLRHLVETKGEIARLLPVSERAGYLFGKESIETPVRRRKKQQQLSLFDAMELPDDIRSGIFGFDAVAKPGNTVLDRIHQSMLLFSTGRSEALKRFLVDDGIGNDTRFWQLAQSLSALYPKDSEEKRWVDGVLARKKGLGF